jgi:hypothetical protein
MVGKTDDRVIGARIAVTGRSGVGSDKPLQGPTLFSSAQLGARADTRTSAGGLRPIILDRRHMPDPRARCGARSFSVCSAIEDQDLCHFASLAMVTAIDAGRCCIEAGKVGGTFSSTSLRVRRSCTSRWRMDGGRSPGLRAGAFSWPRGVVHLWVQHRGDRAGAVLPVLAVDVAQFAGRLSGLGMTTTAGRGDGAGGGAGAELLLGGTRRKSGWQVFC